MKYLLLTACLFLGACGIRENIQASRAEGGDPIETIKVFALNDLRVAKQLALTQSDTIAANCYSALIEVKESDLNRPQDVPIAGGFSAFQKARNLLNSQQSRPNNSVRIACAPLVVDATSTVVRLGVIANGGGGALSIFDRLRGID